MVTLIAPAKNLDHVQTHVIFVHGLNGDATATWQVGNPPEIWPDWLNDLGDGVAVWRLGYPAARSRWKSGTAMHLSDRATSVLPKLASEAGLRNGNIVLVGYSLGGLVVKQTLRLADDQRETDRKNADFVKRVRGVAFIATPHFGSDQAALANRLGPITRSTEATAGLARNDHHLRDLNRWYRTFSDHNGIENLVLYETQPTPYTIRVPFVGLKFEAPLGTIVKPDSADPGLPSTLPIGIDANHDSIVLPQNRSAAVFEHVKEFVSRDFSGKHRDTAIVEAIAASEENVREAVAGSSREILDAVNDLRTPVQGGTRSNALVDKELRRRVHVLRRGRFFNGFDTQGHVQRLQVDLTEGELTQSTNALKGEGLAWVARLLSSSTPRTELQPILARARSLGGGEAAEVADAISLAWSGELPAAHRILGRLSSAAALSAGAIIESHFGANKDPLSWLAAVGKTIGDLDSDGKAVAIGKLFETEQWDRALIEVDALLPQEFDDTPTLLSTFASAHLAQTIPGEFRLQMISRPPLDWRGFPLASDATALNHRRKAREFLQKCADIAEELDCIEAAKSCEEQALWLDLRDPETSEIARERLKTSMSVPDVALRRVPMALQFGLDVDPEAIEREIVRQEALTGETPFDGRIARFMLALRSDDPIHIVSFINVNREQLSTVFEDTFLNNVEVRALVRSGQIPDAQARLDAAVVAGASSEGIEEMKRAIAQANGADPIVQRETEFARTGALADLAALVETLESEQRWDRLVVMAKDLFDRLHDLSTAKIYVHALYEEAQYADIVAFFESYPEFLDQSADLIGSLAWSHFRRGELKPARENLARLALLRDTASDRSLAVNIAIASGQWETLTPFVESEWTKRDTRTAAEILSAAQIGSLVGAHRAEDLAREAAGRANGDPAILIGCYTLATNAGWENSPEVGNWLLGAIENSADDGPIQKISIEELMERQPDWSQRESDTWAQLSSGDLPMFGAARILNRSLIDLSLSVARANLDEPDLRRRGLVFAYSGRPHPTLSSQARLAFDPVALMTLQFLGLLESALAHFPLVEIPYSFLSWLIQERQKIQFHQPSQVGVAREQKQLLDQRRLFAFEASLPVSVDLELEVGDQLAAMLTEAGGDRDADTPQHVVVRPYPIHKPGSLMRELADVSAHTSCLCGVGDLVTALRRLGQLTESQEEQARSYLSSHEQPWQHETIISDGAILYLDDLSVSYLQHLGLLGRLHAAGFKAFLSARETEQNDALIRHGRFVSETTTVIDGLRRHLEGGIESGRVVLGQSNDHGDDDEIHSHPSAAVFRLSDRVDALVVDDRFINQHPHFETDGRQVPIVTTLILIGHLAESGVISAGQRIEYRTKLRQAGYALIPLDAGELAILLERSTVENGKLVETAELKSVRENLLKVRMSNMLQLPKEDVWLDNAFRVAHQTINAQWQTTVSDDIARARSSWLLALVDIRDWLHRYPGGPDMAELKFRSQLLILFGNADGLSIKDRARYLAWLDDAVLARVRLEQREVYDWVVSQLRGIIRHAADMADAEGYDV